MDKPDVDFIEGLSPAISIDQKSTSRNPRSTVGTITEVYDYLRLLYARIGIPHCPLCGAEISRQTSAQIVDQVLELPAGTRYQVLAPVVRRRKGEHAAMFQQLSTEGYARVRIDGVVHPIDEVPPIDKKRPHDIEVVVDRLVAKDDVRRRLSDSIETALRGRARAAPVLRASRVRQLRAELRPARAAHLLVQLAVRRLRDVQRARHAAAGRPRARHR